MFECVARTRVLALACACMLPLGCAHEEARNRQPRVAEPMLEPTVTPPEVPVIPVTPLTPVVEQPEAAPSRAPEPAR